MVRWGLLTGLVMLMLTGGSGNPVQAEVAVQNPAALAQEVADLSRALKMGEAMEILRDEGIASGKDLVADRAADPLWTEALQRIYDPAQMEALFNTAFASALAGDAPSVAAATVFFGSDLGQRVLGLELAARRALMDDAVEAAAAAAYGDLAQDNPARQALIDRFVLANDLIESNVMGALNANLAFLHGLAEAGGKAFDLSEVDMLAQVWGGEPDTRAEMVGWLFPFLTLAYQPLSDAELQDYVAFSETPAGRRVNAAMFQAFDALFNQVSRDLGRAFGRTLQGNDI